MNTELIKETVKLVIMTSVLAVLAVAALIAKEVKADPEDGKPKVECHSGTLTLLSQRPVDEVVFEDNGSVTVIIKKKRIRLSAGAACVTHDEIM